jgi:long-chain acyl-CoA synthetase
MLDVGRIGELTHLPSRLSGIIRPWAELAPDHVAVVDAEGAWSYRQLDAAVSEAARWLRDIGVRGGDRVMLVCENCRAGVAALLAIADLDAWIVCVNARLSEREIDEIRAHCGPRRVIYTVAVSALARAHARRHGGTTHGVPDGLRELAISPEYDAAVPEPVRDSAEAQVSALVYTSGTTGVPKAVMLSHRNLLFMAHVSGRIRELTPHDRFYAVLPMSHIVGFSVVVLGTLLNGATLHLVSRFTPAAALRDLAEKGVSILLGVPSMYSRGKGVGRIDAPSLRMMGACGAPLDQTVKGAAEALFGHTLHNGYGITECAPTIAQTRPAAPRSDCSVGTPLPGVQTKLVGTDGQPVEAGGVGELWVRGPNVMMGYFLAPEATAEVIDADGWFNTRDLARFEGDSLFIVGRTKELIIRFGFNVYPAEIEAVLNDHPAVVQSAVVGHKPGAEEEILAFVQRAPASTVTAEALAAHAAARLAPYKRPTRIFVRDALPAGPTGKVLKSALLREAASLATEG